MNSGALPPRAASSQLWHHILLLVLPAPTSINWNDACSSAQAGGQHRSQIFTARRGGEQCKLSRHHSISSCPAALQHTLFPHEKQHHWGRKRQGMGKNLHTCISLFAFPLPRAHTAAADPAWSPSLLPAHMEKNTGSSRRKGML